LTQKTQKKSKTKSSAKNAKAPRDTAKVAGKSSVRRSTKSAKIKDQTRRASKKKTPVSKQRTHKESITMEAKKKKTSTSRKTAAIAPSPASGLLRQTKSTASALSHLEKAIELIHKRDYKKALAELNGLCQSFPEETEILARARSYILICEREAGIRKKAEVSTDQLYALGVMEHNKENYDEAILYYEKSLKNNPDTDYIYYSIAASHAMRGEFDASMKNLRKAIELNEDSRIYARNDEDFSDFLENEEFGELVGLNQNPVSDPQ